MSASPAPFGIARALLREGRLADAEQLMVKEIAAAERRHGRGSREWASAQCDLALSCLANASYHVGDQEGRVAAIRKVLASYERQGRAEDALRATCGLALAQSDAGDAPGAMRTYEQAMANLDAAHPDAVSGRSHLGAIIAGRACGCGDIQGAMADAFREFVLGRLPQDLLERLDVTIEDNDFKINVGLRRAPTEEELEGLNQVIQGATAEFRHRMTTARNAS